MRTKKAIREMYDALTAADNCLPGSRDLDYVDAPTRDELEAYMRALWWVLDEEDYALTRCLNVLGEILAGKAEPLETNDL